MTIATRHFHPRIAVVFDFDDTLAPSTYHTLVRSLGMDPDRFTSERINPLVDDRWESLLARAYALVHYRRTHPDVCLNAELFRKLGRDLELYDGVPEMFQKVRETSSRVLPELEVEFLLHQEHGIAIGLFKSDDASQWRSRSEMRPDRRLENLVPVDYREDSELMRSLLLAVESVSKRAALLQLSANK